ncbi:helix-turn-helix domain-containing protein [Paracoccus pantotrophus]|uniref:Helix-turn-helix domain-containing protein n=1 Tax=Paracoccus pantotrophus TaxID=82367 RepID=A0A7H9BYF9_PARPN|nr:helix-turn-helix domain-containing protein [Paracoccus pantotrophus]RNI16124.1 helix-turn-helix domain-containing protein [Paracoccus pantotrophus]RQP05441.1 MAG: helix-turn-helix domain-containing protein [Paracoccus sp. BP8]
MKQSRTGRHPGVSNKHDGIAAAAQALAAGDALTALKRVALRDDPPALALRGIAMAQLGDLDRARDLLRRAARGLRADPLARARCRLAAAEIALVTRDLGGLERALGTARGALAAQDDWANAAHAGYLQARLLLLTGRLYQAEAVLEALDTAALPPASRPGCWLVAAGIAMRRIRAGDARVALDRAARAAQETGIAALAAEVAQARAAFDAPAARLIESGRETLLDLAGVEALIGSDMLLVDACRNFLRCGATVVPLAGRPVLMALLRALAEAWPGDVSRETLLARAFRARHADESHRARLRVEIGRLRGHLAPLAEIRATGQGFVLEPRGGRRIAVLAPPVEGDHAGLLALLADGEAWSSSALALALDVSPRSVQRALAELRRAGRVEWFGHGRARRWIARSIPGFPTSLLLPAPLPMR